MSTSETLRCLPYFTRGEVVTGFGRGSKQLGIPTGETDFICKDLLRRAGSVHDRHRSQALARQQDDPSTNCVLLFAVAVVRNRFKLSALLVRNLEFNSRPHRPASCSSRGTGKRITGILCKDQTIGCSFADPLGMFESKAVKHRRRHPRIGGNWFIAQEENNAPAAHQEADPGACETNTARNNSAIKDFFRKRRLPDENFPNAPKQIPQSGDRVFQNNVLSGTRSSEPHARRSDHRLWGCLLFAISTCF